MSAGTDLRHRLARTYTAFFGGFDHLREVQVRALPVVLDGGDALIASATASGKTEAFAAPAAEIALASGNASASVLILSPTRALANDLKRRLEGPMSRAQTTFGRYTGEHKERVGGALPAIVIATPEALDSLLARRPELLRRVRLVVIDEIHVLDGTPRGDQLRVLLHRLEQAALARPARVAVSATMDDPEAFAARYLERPTLIIVEGRRKIAARPFFGRAVGELADHLGVLAAAGARKILIFCRSRNQVETYATKLRARTRFAAHVFAHHGSMSKAERERTERQFLTAPAALCFATLTLEMGIDIGSVDYVLLIGPPADVSSLLQRIGRGGRRGDSTRFGYVVDTAADQHIVRTMTRLGAAGQLCGAPYGFRPSILVQQVFVLTGAAHLEPGDLLASVPRELWPAAETAWARTLLEHLVEHGSLERTAANRYVLTEATEQRFSLGTLHSNIDASAGTQVVDRLTGDTLGTIDSPSSRLNLAGGARRLAALTPGRALTDAARIAEPARFRTNQGPTVTLPLARAVIESLGVEPRALAAVQRPGSTRLLHGLGTVGAKALVQLLESAGTAVDPSSVTPYTLELPRPLDEFPTLPPEFIPLFLTQNFPWLERRTTPGPWASATPLPWREAAVHQAHGLAELGEYLRHVRLMEFSLDRDHEPILEDL